MPEPEFNIPANHETYVASILDRCQKLIANGIWSGIPQDRISQWMKNFTDDKERYFAACILDALIYRSNEQTKSLIFQLFSRSLPDLVRRYPLIGKQVKNWFKSLADPNIDPGVRLVLVVKREDPPTKSAYIIARMLKQQYGIAEGYIILPTKIHECIETGINTFIFIDDFLGTGTQFEELLGQLFGNEELLSICYLAYTPLVAHCQGVDYLREKFPDIRVAAAELLDESCNIFKDSSSFNDGTNTPESAEAFYIDLLNRKQIREISYQFGYGGLGLLYAFEHAAPDNSLPILWWNRNLEAWSPLFNR